VDSTYREQQQRRDAAMAFYSLLSKGWHTVHAANSGVSRSQDELGFYHYHSAKRLDILHGTPADDATVRARWAEALKFTEMAAEQGVAGAQAWCGLIYATGGRSVPQNWPTAVKWWRKAADAGRMDAQWFVGVCYYHGRGVDRDVTRAMVWFRKSAAQGNPAAFGAVYMGVPAQGLRGVILRFTNAGGDVLSSQTVLYRFKPLYLSSQTVLPIRPFYLSNSTCSTTPRRCATPTRRRARVRQDGI
jgi:TPR repeat protein